MEECVCERIHHDENESATQNPSLNLICAQLPGIRASITHFLRQRRRNTAVSVATILFISGERAPPAHVSPRPKDGPAIWRYISRFTTPRIMRLIHDRARIISIQNSKLNWPDFATFEYHFIFWNNFDPQHAVISVHGRRCSQQNIHQTRTEEKSNLFQTF